MLFSASKNCFLVFLIIFYFYYCNCLFNIRKVCEFNFFFQIRSRFGSRTQAMLRECDVHVDFSNSVLRFNNQTNISENNHLDKNYIEESGTSGLRREAVPPDITRTVIFEAEISNKENNTVVDCCELDPSLEVFKFDINETTGDNIILLPLTDTEKTWLDDLSNLLDKPTAEGEPEKEEDKNKPDARGTSNSKWGETEVENSVENISKEETEMEKTIDDNGDEDWKPDSEIESEEEGDIAHSKVKKNGTPEKSYNPNKLAHEKPGNLSQAKKHTKCNRIKGEQYFGYKRTQGKVFYNIPRCARQLKDRACTHKDLSPKKNGRTFLCACISEQKRQDVFNYFWKELSTWNENISFVKGLVATREIKRRRKGNNTQQKKNEGHDIYLPKDNGEKVIVCRRFFISTLNLGEDTFKRWVRNVQEINTDSDQEKPNSEEEMVEDVKEKRGLKIKLPTEGKKVCHREKRKTKTDNVRNWLNLLPKIPSHYCRASSKKIYVESNFRSFLHMYNVFLEWCKDNNISPIGRKLFTEVLIEENIAIHQPRKDQCDLCCSFKLGNIDEGTYQAHVAKKDRARATKKAEEESASEEKLVVTMDLQSVLLCPKTLASSMYYKQKLQLHNFTIYEINKPNQDVHLYVWNEVEGGITSNKFTTCIIDYIKNVPFKYKKIVLISDGCTYQNRNKILASALSDVSKNKQIIIEQLFLEKGHTMMQADNVHSVLEHLFKPPINSPSDYIARMRLEDQSNPTK